MSSPLLSTVATYIRKYACDPDHGIAPYSDSAIMQGWQNLAALPHSTEFCVLTLTASIRHGTGEYTELSGTENDSAAYANNYERLVTVDMFATQPYTAETDLRARAEALNVISNSWQGAAWFQQTDRRLFLASADDLQEYGALDDTQNSQLRITQTLHILETVRHTVSRRYIEHVKINPTPLL